MFTIPERFNPAVELPLAFAFIAAMALAGWMLAGHHAGVSLL